MQGVMPNRGSEYIPNLQPNLEELAYNLVRIFVSEDLNQA